MRLSKFSIPDLRVKVEEGQPLQLPFITTVTTPSLKDLKVSSFWKVYNLEWYIHLGLSFNLLPGLDVFSSLGYYGGFLNVYNDGKFEMNPKSNIDLSTNGIEWVLGLSCRLFGKKS